MNDYLDNLVAKSLGLAEVVAPRPMSLFEPAPSDAGPLVHDSYSLEQGAAPQRTPAGASPITNVAAPLASEDEVSEKTPHTPRVAQADQPSQRPVQPFDRDASLSAPLLIPRRPADDDEGQRADNARSAAPMNQQPADQQPLNQQTVEGHQAAPAHAPLRIVPQATTPAEHRVPDAPEAGPLTPAQARAAPITTPASSGAMLVAPASLRRADQEGGRASPDRVAVPAPAPDAATPTIKITIGRVDVRAVTLDKESPRAREAERRNPALTLEEYLKRRSGGKS
jgi:hypothetical protein